MVSYEEFIGMKRKAPVKSSSGDEGSVHPYLKARYYTIHCWSLNPGYTDRYRDELAKREALEWKRLAKLNRL